MHEVARTDNGANVDEVLSGTISSVHVKLVALLAGRGQARERYAALRNRVKTQAAHYLIARIREEIEELEQRESERVYKRRATSKAKLTGAVERFVGDLLRVRAGTLLPANIYRAVGRSEFSDAHVKYDTFVKVLDGLKALDLVGHQKGKSRYRKTLFGNAPERGHAARFWAPAAFCEYSWRFSADGWGRSLTQLAVALREHFSSAGGLQKPVDSFCAPSRGGSGERPKRARGLPGVAARHHATTYDFALCAPRCFLNLLGQRHRPHCTPPEAA
jgi:hypothetical protein